MALVPRKIRAVEEAPLSDPSLNRPVRLELTHDVVRRPVRPC